MTRQEIFSPFQEASRRKRDYVITMCSSPSGKRVRIHLNWAGGIASPDCLPCGHIRPDGRITDNVDADVGRIDEDGTVWDTHYGSSTRLGRIGLPGIIEYFFTHLVADDWEHAKAISSELYRRFHRSDR